MQLGAFSISLAVKDIDKSKAFYEKFGFQQVAGDIDQNWVILRNGTTNVGLFQGMFENNILTFNPGWDSAGEEQNPFTDVRELQQVLMAQGIEISAPADPNSEGPAHFVVTDPDGNIILVDQHRT